MTCMTEIIKHLSDAIYELASSSHSADSVFEHLHHVRKHLAAHIARHPEREACEYEGSAPDPQESH